MSPVIGPRSGVGFVPCRKAIPSRETAPTPIRTRMLCAIRIAHPARPMMVGRGGRAYPFSSSGRVGFRSTTRIALHEGQTLSSGPMGFMHLGHFTRPSPRPGRKRGPLNQLSDEVRLAPLDDPRGAPVADRLLGGEDDLLVRIRAAQGRPRLPWFRRQDDQGPSHVALLNLSRNPEPEAGEAAGALLRPPSDDLARHGRGGGPRPGREAGGGHDVPPGPPDGGGRPP